MQNTGRETAPLALGVLVGVLFCVASSAAARSTTAYRHGEPTDAEQLMLELVNRARANPLQEASRWGIPLNSGLRPGTISATRKQPLAFHPRLITAARRHSNWMLQTGIFSHYGKGRSEPWDRMRRAGYRLTGRSMAGENIAYYASSLPDPQQEITHSHHEGLFRSRGHRVNMMRADYDDVGLGIVGEWVHEEISSSMYTSHATQKFARSNFTRLPFALGVAYCDLNGNNFYDIGEGLRGVRVSVPGARHHAITSTSGGFAVPVPARGGRRTVSFELDDLTHFAAVRSRARANFKVDWRLPYAAPILSGPTEVAVFSSARYVVTPVAAATSIDVFIQQQGPATDDGAEDLARVTHRTTGGYTPLSSAFWSDGQSAYHLQPATKHEEQWLQYRDYLLPGPRAALSFESLLRAPTETLSAIVEISDDDGRTWVQLLARRQTGPAASEFTPSYIPLDAYAGRYLLLRFSLVETSADAAQRAMENAGWFIDSVKLEDVELRSTVAVASAGSDRTVNFQPSRAGRYLLTAVPRHHERMWPAGPTSILIAR